MATLNGFCILTAFQKYGFFVERKDQCIDNTIVENIKNDLFGFQNLSLEKFIAFMPRSIYDWNVTHPKILPHFKDSNDKINAQAASQFEDLVSMYKKPKAPLSCTLFKDQINDLMIRFSYFYNRLQPKNKLATFVGLPQEINWTIVAQQYNRPEVRFFSFGLGDGSHWTCLFLDKRKQTYEYYDSKGNSMSKELKKIIQSHLPKKVWEENQRETQKDGKSCGLYVLAYTFYRTFLETPSHNIINQLFFNDQNVYTFFKSFIIEQVADDNILQALHPDELQGFHEKIEPKPFSPSFIPYDFDFSSLYAVYKHLCISNPTSPQIYFLEQVWRALFLCLSKDQCVKTPKCDNLTGCEYIKCMIEDTAYDDETFQILKDFAEPIRNTDGTINRDLTLEKRKYIQHKLYSNIDRSLFIFHSHQTTKDIQQQAKQLFKALKNDFAKRLDYMPPLEKAYYTNTLVTVSSLVILLGLFSKLYL